MMRSEEAVTIALRDPSSWAARNAVIDLHRSVLTHCPSQCHAQSRAGMLRAARVSCTGLAREQAVPR
jgi:hypothetical protein